MGWRLEPRAFVSKVGILELLLFKVRTPPALLPQIQTG